MSKTEQRSSKLTIRLSKLERTDLQSKASKSGYGESEYVRQILSKRQIKQLVIPQVNQATYQELARLRLELTRQGTNLNQLVKLANSRQQIPAEVARQLAILIKAYQQLQAQITSCQAQVLMLELDLNDRENSAR